MLRRMLTERVTDGLVHDSATVALNYTRGAVTKNQFSYICLCDCSALELCSVSSELDKSCCV